MRQILLFLVAFISLNSCFAQSKKYKKLKAENEQLRQNLKECKETSILSLLMLNKENPTYSKNDLYTQEEMKEKIISEIKENNPDLLPQTQQLETLIRDYCQYIDSLKFELIEKTGGIDPKSKKPIGFRDIKITNKILLEDGKASELKATTLALREALKKATKDKDIQDKLLTGKFDHHKRNTSKTWEEYTFGQMPLAAIIPMLGKFKHDAQKDQTTLLKSYRF